MDKQQILSFIKSQLDSGKVTKDDVAQILGTQAASPLVQLTEHPQDAVAVEQEDSSRKLVHAFYGIGMVIVLVGIVILIIQNWSEIGFFGRFLVTLGISAVTYISGILLRGDSNRVISQVMFTISATLAPVGVFIVLDEAGTRITEQTHTFVALALAFVYTVAQMIARRSILTLIIGAFATWAYYAALINLLDSGYDFDWMQWATIVLGFCYIFVAAGLNVKDSKDNISVQRVFYTAGTLAILGAGITLGGAWDMLYIIFLFGAFYASVFLRSSTMLVLGAMFLTAHIIKLTSEYFIDSIGWPVALIFCGFCIIGIGYATLQINRKYIKAV